ncbi:MAG: Na+ dependent nucleoside transporter, partial [Saprospiraceae bacterium]|nr:Na+ dependent nucleoside transporter [Saprospiraceae bacterium]
DFKNVIATKAKNIDANVSVSSQKIGSNILDAIANGTTEGLKLAANVRSYVALFL